MFYTPKPRGSVCAQISNREAIAVNQAWAGHSGSPFKQSEERIILSDLNYAAMTLRRRVVT